MGRLQPAPITGATWTRPESTGSVKDYWILFQELFANRAGLYATYQYSRSFHIVCPHAKLNDLLKGGIPKRGFGDRFGEVKGHSSSTLEMQFFGLGPIVLIGTRNALGVGHYNGTQASDFRKRVFVRIQLQVQRRLRYGFVRLLDGLSEPFHGRAPSRLQYPTAGSSVLLS